MWRSGQALFHIKPVLGFSPGPVGTFSIQGIEVIVAPMPGQLLVQAVSVAGFSNWG